jgi:hypothetical protein
MPAPSKLRNDHYPTVFAQRSFTDNFERLGVRHGLCRMSVCGLRCCLGRKNERDPSKFAKLEVKAKSVWNHLDRVYLKS